MYITKSRITYRRTALFIVLSFLSALGLSAQSLSEKAISTLSNRGFENIRVLQQGNQVICTIERGLDRSPASDLQQALTLLQQIYSDQVSFRIILLEQGQPVYELKEGSEWSGLSNREKADTCKQLVNLSVSYADQGFFKSIKETPVARKLQSGISLTLYPQLSLRNMKLDHVYDVQFNVAPAVSYSAWRGMLLTAQLILPIYNNLNFEGDYIRFGFLTFTQGFRFPHLNHLRFTVGNFNNHRYGIDMIWKKQFENSRWSLAANIGYTGYSNNYDMYWNHSSLNQLSWKAKGSYYLPRYQLRTDLSLGRFIAGDDGFRLDIYRHFGETTIGVYATYTGHDPNGGFHFSIPISPQKRKHSYRVRAMLAPYFDMEYNARNEFVYNRYYKTSPDENRSYQDLYPQYIRNQIINP